MKFTDLLRMSASSLLKRKVRTILTILGVVIGTTSIVVMMSLGFGMKNAMMKDAESYGSLTKIEVMASGWYGDSQSEEELRLDDELVETISMMEHVESVTPVLETTALLRCGNYENYLSIRGMSIDALQRLNIPLQEGSLPAEGEDLKMVYGNWIIAEFYDTKTGSYVYWETGELPDIDLYQDTLYMIFDMNSYYMQGTEDESGQIIQPPKKYIIETAGVVAGGPDEWNAHSYYAYCDIEALKLLLQREFRDGVIPGQPTMASGKPYKEIFYTSIDVYVDEMENVTALQTVISDMGYSTYSEAEWIESEMQSMNIIQAVLGGIGAVSLLVAAIGITNTMMMSIYERTKEIGIMKVIGCRIRDIQVLFLLEAGYIGFVGGVIGVGLSYGLSAVINKIISGSDMGISSISYIPAWLALISVAFAIIIGMVSGFIPSVRAMRLSPLAAIRSE